MFIVASCHVKCSHRCRQLRAHSGPDLGDANALDPAISQVWSWQPLPKGGQTSTPMVISNIAVENGYLYWIFPLNLVIFHCYIKLPEGRWLKYKVKSGCTRKSKYEHISEKYGKHTLQVLPCFFKAHQLGPFTSHCSPKMYDLMRKNGAQNQHHSSFLGGLPLIRLWLLYGWINMYI